MIYCAYDCLVIKVLSGEMDILKLIGPDRELIWTLQFWPVLVASFVCALAATWLCKRIALKLGIVDRPDDLVKTHKEPVAYLGGVGILVGLIFGVLTGVYLILGADAFSTSFKWLLGILAGATIACSVGVMDDIFDLKPWQKMLGQFIAACTLLAAGITPSLNYLASPFGWTMPQSLQMILATPIVIFFVLGATNSLNLLDGLDGLCAGTTGIITVAMLLLTIHLATWNFSVAGDPVRLIVCLALVGAVFGFLPFNRHPAKIFMGDAGSMLLGFCVAALMMLFAERSPRWWMASMVVFAFPMLDTAVSLLRRLINKRPLFVSDRGHIYDQMMDRGMTLNKTVRMCYLITAAYALVGLVSSQIRIRYALIIYLILVADSIDTVYRKGYLKMEGMRGATKKEDQDIIVRRD